MIRRFLLAVAWLPAILGAEGRAEEIRVREFQYRTTVRVTAFAEKAETIVNTLRWPQIKYLAPDGAYVREGDVVTEFDPEEVAHDLKDLQFERAEIEADLARTLTDIRNKDMKLHDDLAGLRDRMEVLKSRIARYRGMPDKDEVQIAEGKLRVAELESAAASNELAKAQSRLDRQMISPAEFEQVDQAFRLKKAQCENARRHSEYISLPAPPLTVEKFELEMSNIRMEIEKLEHETRENAEISKIRQAGATVRREIIDRSIKEKEEELQKTKVRAPLSGHIVHLRSFKDRILRSGNKLWKDFPYLRMPDDRTLAFKGLLLESDRKFFKPGDKADLHVIGSPPLPHEGRIASISALSHDMAEKDERAWGTQKEKGIVVFDIVIRPTATNDWFRTGMHAVCELVSSERIKGPSVPVTFVKEKNREYHLSLDGVYRPVTGKIIQGYLLLDDASLAGRRVETQGRFPDEPRKNKDEGKSACFKALGELVPNESADVIAKKIYGAQKITWLVDEDKDVKQGDVVVRLDETEIRENIRTKESRMKEAESAREALEEQVKLRNREGQFQLAREKNLLQIAEINWKLSGEDRDWPAIYDAQLSHTELAVRLEAIDKRIQRMEGKEVLSAFELDRMKRDRARLKLQKEAAGIRLAILSRGADAVARQQAEFAYVEQKLKVETLEKRTETDRFRVSRELLAAKTTETYARKALEDRRTSQENHTITAPRDGLVQYGMVWSGGTLSKIAVGSMAGPGSILMRIADISRLHVRAEIPEVHYNRIYKGLPVQVEIPSLTDITLSGTVTDIEFLFENKRQKDTEIGLYSSQEPLGETIFYAHVQVQEPVGLKLKPGAVAHVWFPFRRQEGESSPVIP